MIKLKINYTKRSNKKKIAIKRMRIKYKVKNKQEDNIEFWNKEGIQNEKINSQKN